MTIKKLIPNEERDVKNQLHDTNIHNSIMALPYHEQQCSYSESHFLLSDLLDWAFSERTVATPISLTWRESGV